MLQNAYLLAKIGADTAENEQQFAENLPKICNYPTGPLHRSAAESWSAAAETPEVALRAACSAALRPLAWWGLGLAKVANLKKYNILQFFGRQARSRLYQNEFLQENMRLTAFFKLYKICILLHRCNLKIFAKNRFEKTAIFVKFQQKNCKIL